MLFFNECEREKESSCEDTIKYGLYRYRPSHMPVREAKSKIEIK